MDRRLADWQLPVGVDRPLSEYLQSRSIADDYDRTFETTNLLRTDVEYLKQYFPVPGSLVDLGCGTGRILTEFASTGYEVVGIDLSRPMLRVVDAKRTEQRLPIELIEANLCELGFLKGHAFDYACCMFSTLGMVVGVDRRKQVVDHVFRMLKPGGVFCLHVHNLWYNWTVPLGRRWLIQDLLRRLLNRKDTGDKVQPSYRGIPNLRIHLFTETEITRLLTQAGFAILDLTRLAPDRTGPAQRRWNQWLHSNGWLIAVQKPKED